MNRPVDKDKQLIVFEIKKNVPSVTLKELLRAGLSRALVDRIAKALGKPQADNEGVPLTKILEVAGIDVAIFSLRALSIVYKFKAAQFCSLCAAEIIDAVDSPESVELYDLASRYAFGGVKYDDLESYYASYVRRKSGREGWARSNARALKSETLRDKWRPEDRIRGFFAADAVTFLALACLSNDQKSIGESAELCTLAGRRASIRADSAVATQVKHYVESFSTP